MKLVVATHNQGKIKEFNALFANQGVDILSLQDVHFHDDIEETGETFEENAQIKAETVARAVGLPVVADDSGLAVDALNGAPGVYSARYAGEHKSDDDNNAKLLKELEGEEQRGAAFVCVLALSIPGKSTRFYRGECRGIIGMKEMGNHGFGYDPLFILPDRHKTMAELSPAEKNEISHRSIALQSLMSDWTSISEEAEE
ncbi:XTP/dITP diphosphatase [Bacillaceae bacterium SIJ1]|uniref:XTP/dITP diphosphatase n=1 Tax=Litoribacterium kuwaitense TaxID=1398745 RepID=UPI0013EAA8E9|nr:XTP/dITP diphosphatase [Litoribacterium kuwaitense]NGP44984.1 XTP/dITP diphosphatase [Litoribacterium kuwaitense]